MNTGAYIPESKTTTILVKKYELKKKLDCTTAKHTATEWNAENSQIGMTEYHFWGFF